MGIYPDTVKNIVEFDFILYFDVIKIINKIL